MVGSVARVILEKIERLGKDMPKAQETDITTASETYMRDADSVHRHIRAKSHRFFLLRFWRYPPLIMFQQLATYFKNRIHERFA